MNEQQIVIVGAGKAGTEAAFALRRQGFQGGLILLGEEENIPYERPPLSKGFLAGRQVADELAIRHPRLFERERISLQAGSRVTAIDRASKTVCLENGARISYGILILATGARAYRPALPGFNLPGVVTLRDREDAMALREGIRPGSRLMILGGGFLGLEVAATARGLGADIAVFERDDRILARVAPQAISDLLMAAHKAAGVRIETGILAVKVERSADGLSLHLDDGRVVEGDALLLATGSQPSIELAVSAGLPCRRGVLVDATGRTADPAIFAIGDVAEIPHPQNPNATLVIESIDAALTQAQRVAKAITGKPLASDEPPWFWSEQFENRFQSVGLFDPQAESHIVRSEGGTAIAVYQISNDRLVSAAFINAAPAFMAARRAMRPGNEAMAQEIVAGLLALS